MRAQHVTAGVALATAVWTVRHRRSSIVRSWAPPASATTRSGPLAHRLIEANVDASRVGRSVILLHGLGASGRYFGSLYDRLDAVDRVVIPDLLGFGDDRDPERTDYSFEAHLDALADLVDMTIPDSASIAIGAHSMGSALGLALARRYAGRVVRVVLWGPPVYESAADLALDASSHTGMTRLLLSDSDWAERLCRVNCASPDAMGWAMAAMAPTMPTPIARDASRHTWNSFEGSLRSLVLDADWRELFDESAPVTMVRGSADGIGDVATIRDVAATRATVELLEVAGGDHHVAITHPSIGRDLLGRHSDPFRRQE